MDIRPYPQRIHFIQTYIPNYRKIFRQLKMILFFKKDILIIQSIYLGNTDHMRDGKNLGLTELW